MGSEGLPSGATAGKFSWQVRRTDQDALVCTVVRIGGIAHQRVIVQQQQRQSSIDDNDLRDTTHRSHHTGTRRQPTPP